MPDFKNRKRLFAIAPAGLPRFTLLVAAAIVLMVLDHREGHLQSVHSALSLIAYPVQVTVNAPYRFSNWVSEELSSRQRLIDENRTLRAKALENAASLQRLAALQQENDRLRALMDAAAQVHGRVLVAELEAIDLDPFRQEVVINKGVRDGVYPGQPILDAHGIMGQITEAGFFSSKAILITDPSHALPVEINRNGLHTLAVGTGDINHLDLPYLPNNADVKVGDLLISSGLGGRFPRGYPAGVITQVKRVPGQPFATVSAKPAAQIDRSHEVLLLWPPQAPHGKHTKPANSRKQAGPRQPTRHSPENRHG